MQKLHAIFAIFRRLP